MSLLSRSFVLFTYFIVSVVTVAMLSQMLQCLIPSLSLLSLASISDTHSTTDGADVQYYAPRRTVINDLDRTLGAGGVYGFIFNTSQTPADLPHQTYNWCNMPHVRRQEYPKPPTECKLKYAEVIHRHHKRTPYSDNTFPIETQQWDCSDVGLYQYSQPLDPGGNASANVYQCYYTSPINAFTPQGFPPYSCAFPQITRQGLDDSLQHGRDAYGVYHDLLGLIPDEPDSSKVAFRVTNNPITAQVAGMVISGMYGPDASFGPSTVPDAATEDVQAGPTQTKKGIPLLIQPTSVDSQEPQYPCPRASSIQSSFSTGSPNPRWQRHLFASADLFASLDAILGIDPQAPDWHTSYDHYFDNLSARLCHQHPLPCNTTFSPERCITQAQADKVFRLGEWEYAWTWRDAGPDTLEASRGSFGVWIAELAAHLRAAAAGESTVVYRHDVAHDGSLSRLLSLLQMEEMVWPGMGAEVVFELWRRDEEDYLRMLWSGQVLESSTPVLRGDEYGMLPLERVLGYFDSLVGRRASSVKQLCEI